MNTKDEIGKRQEFYKRRQGELALERLGLSQRIEEIDKELAGYATAQEANALALRDLDTESAVAAAKAASQPTQNRLDAGQEVKTDG